MQSILVTGGNGFIGSSLVKELSYYPQYKVTLYHREPINQHKNLVNELIVNQPNVVVHLAGNPLVKTSYDILLRDNVELTELILKYMVGGRLVFASSATIYGDLYNAIEEDVTIPTSTYGYTKLISENLINSYVLAGRIEASILRFVANVGPEATHGVLRDLIDKYKNNDILEILGAYPGSQKPYTHVSDTVQAILMAINGELTGTFNVGLNDALSVSDIVESILEYYGPKEIKWLGANSVWKGDNPIVRINNTKILEAGWSPKYKTSKEAVNAVIRG